MPQHSRARPKPSGTPRCAAIIVAAGSGVRAAAALGQRKTPAPDLPKQFWPLGTKPVIAHSLDYFDEQPSITAIIIVLADFFIDKMADLLSTVKTPVHIVGGGATRQDSVRAGLCKLAGLPDAEGIDYVAIHDAARPLIPLGLLDQLIAATNMTSADAVDDSKIIGAVPILPIADSVKTVTPASPPPQELAGRLVTGGIDRSLLGAAQTPQLFRRQAITDLHNDFADNDGFTDDCSLAEAAGFQVIGISGAKQLMKLTDADDFAMLTHLANAVMTAPRRVQTTDQDMTTETRLGTGFDVHKFSDEAGPIWIAGIKLDSDRKMLAHSDGDVGLHALCDAIFGALADGDIGAHFPPSDPKWKNADSAKFLKFAVDRVAARGGSIINLDLTIICEAPKIGPHRDAMRQRIAEICGLPIDRVGVKATTSEGLGFTGRGEGIAAQASASIAIPAAPKPTTSMSTASISARPSAPETSGTAS